MQNTVDPQWKSDVLSTLVDSWASNIDELYSANLLDNGERDFLSNLPRREQCGVSLKILPRKGIGAYVTGFSKEQKSERFPLDFSKVPLIERVKHAPKKRFDPRWES